MKTMKLQLIYICSTIHIHSSENKKHMKKIQINEIFNNRLNTNKNSKLFIETTTTVF